MTTLKARVLALLQARDGGIGQAGFVEVHGGQPGAERRKLTLKSTPTKEAAV